MNQPTPNASRGQSCHGWARHGYAMLCQSCAMGTPRERDKYAMGVLWMRRGHAVGRGRSMGAPCYVCVTYLCHIRFACAMDVRNMCHVLPMNVLGKRHVNAVGALRVWHGNAMGMPLGMSHASHAKARRGCATDVLWMSYGCASDVPLMCHGCAPYVFIGCAVSDVRRPWVRWRSAMDLP